MPRAENLKIAAYRTLLGHTASVQSVAAQPTANMVCSGSTQYELKMNDLSIVLQGLQSNEKRG
ncbi:putative transcription factor WD40-like family [Helianthus annuus]|nr:putative transcription factor WD40-like family [Helianthus annuus]